MAIVISDTSPVRAIAHLGHLDWLRDLFGEILIPPAVAAELQHPPASFSPVDPTAWPFLVVQSPTDRKRVIELRSELDAGEAEAIALAEEIRAELVLVDERAGRQIASRCGFTVMGTLGLLVRAKQRGLCALVAPLLDRLRDELNFFVSSGLRHAVLKQAGEE